METAHNSDALMLPLMIDCFSKPTLVFFGTLRGQVLPYLGNKTVGFFFYHCRFVWFCVGSYRAAQESNDVRVSSRESRCF